MARRRIIYWIAIVYATLVFTNISAAYRVTPVKRDECPKKQEINCQEIQTSDGFTYHAPEMNLNDDCEHGWFHPNETFIADSTGNGTRPKSLTMRNCVNLQWQIKCDKSLVIECVIDISVSDQSKYATNDSLARNNTSLDDNRDYKQKKDLKGVRAWVIIAVIVILFVFVVVGLVHLRKKKYCLQRFNLCGQDSVV